MAEFENPADDMDMGAGGGGMDFGGGGGMDFGGDGGYSGGDYGETATTRATSSSPTRRARPSRSTCARTAAC